MDFTSEEKALLVARHLPCDQCSCQGWRPSVLQSTQQNKKEQQQLDSNNNSVCDCGHPANEHLDHWEDMDRRLKLALRIKDILKVLKKAHCLELVV